MPVAGGGAFPGSFHVDPGLDVGAAQSGALQNGASADTSNDDTQLRPDTSANAGWDSEAFMEESRNLAQWYYNDQKEENRRLIEQQNKYNAEQARIAREFEKKQADTAYQRAVADMKAAGLNPALLYANSAASSPVASGHAASNSASAVARQPSYNDENYAYKEKALFINSMLKLLDSLASSASSIVSLFPKAGRK